MQATLNSEDHRTSGRLQSNLLLKAESPMTKLLRALLRTWNSLAMETVPSLWDVCSLPLDVLMVKNAFLTSLYQVPLTTVEFVVHHNLEVLFSIQPVMHQLVSIQEPLPSQAKDFIFVITEFLGVSDSPFLQPGQVTLDGSLVTEHSLFLRIWVSSAHLT